MEIVFTRLEVHGCLVVRVSGSIDRGGAKSLHDLLERECGLRLDQNIFFDVSQMANIDLTYADMVDLIGPRRRFFGEGPGSRIALWAPTDMTFGMSRMYAALLDQFDSLKVEVFRDRDRAAEFLGLSPDLVDESQMPLVDDPGTGHLPSI